MYVLLFYQQYFIFSNAVQYVLHIATCYDTLMMRCEVYERFDFDFKNACFEWDENKEKDNFRKHGVRFGTAAKVFLDPDKLIRRDYEHPGERYCILGRVGKILFVVCTFIDAETVRLISARLASIPEKERYKNGENRL